MIKKNPSSEIDVYAKNEQITGVWKELGTPIIFEAKNWDNHVNADQIRNLVLKATGSKTKFMIAWNGISGQNETKGARLEIIKAKEKGIFLIVLTKIDFEMNAGVGVLFNPLEGNIMKNVNCTVRGKDLNLVLNCLK